MKKHVAFLVLALSTALALAAPPGTGFGYSRTATITTTASTVTVPACVAVGTRAKFQHVKVRSPSTNTDLIYLRSDTTATSSDLSIVPGASEEVSMASGTLSIVAASGTQTVDLISSCTQ